MTSQLLQNLRIILMLVTCWVRLSRESAACQKRNWIDQRGHAPPPMWKLPYYLDGQYYWIAVTASPYYDVRYPDCTGIRFQYQTDSRSRVVVTNSPHVSDRKTFEIDITDDRIIVYYRERGCAVKQPGGFGNFYVNYFNEFDGYLCFFYCGQGDADDYVSCFSRRQTFSLADRENLLKKLYVRGVGQDLQIDAEHFKRIDRTKCGD